MEITVLVVILVFIAVYIFIYNKLVAAKQNVHEAWSDVDVQLKRRHDLIPQLIDVVRGYAKHEKDLLEKITHERAQALALDKDDLKSLAHIERALGEGLSSLFMVAEGYPDLKANTTFLKLQEQMSETEDQIASSRRIYNSNTADYNTLIKLFPLNLIAALHHFTESKFLEK